MGHIYDDRHEIPIPLGAHINRSDVRVFLMDTVDSKRTVIGKATSETTMFPNDMFKKLYPDIWKTEYAKYNDPPVHEMKMGMYGLCLGAGERNGLYKALMEAYDGAKNANAIMDFAMYSILNPRNDPELYTTRMMEEITFSEENHDAAWWTEFFGEKLTESQHNEFRRVWMRHCQEKGIRKVWLCIGDVTDDHEMGTGQYDNYGENKARTSRPITGYIWAISAEDGLTITYYAPHGGDVDAKAIQWLIQFLVGYGFEVEGVLLDRELANIDMLKLLDGLKMDYVIRLPNCYGMLSMMEQEGDTIFWNPEYLVNGNNLYGTSKEQKIWRKYAQKGIVNLYYSPQKGHSRGQNYNEEATKGKEKAERECRAGMLPKIPGRLREILSVKRNEDGTLTLNCDYEKWRRRLKGEGFFSILSSRDYGAAMTYRLFRLRQASEVQFRRSRLRTGAHASQVHSESGMNSRLAIAFVASILRHTIGEACAANGLNTNVILQRTNRVMLLVLGNGHYKLIHGIPEDLRTVYEYFGMNNESLEAITEEVNRRKTDGMHTPVREFPIPRGPIKRGRKPGSKNKKTIEREKAEAEARAGVEAGAKETAKKPGRPVGTKDSKPRKKRSDAGKKRGPHKKQGAE